MLSRRHRSRSRKSGQRPTTRSSAGRISRASSRSRWPEWLTRWRRRHVCFLRRVCAAVELSLGLTSRPATIAKNAEVPVRRAKAASTARGVSRLPIRPSRGCRAGRKTFTRRRSPARWHGAAALRARSGRATSERQEAAARNDQPHCSRDPASARQRAQPGRGRHPRERGDAAPAPGKGTRVAGGAAPSDQRPHPSSAPVSATITAAAPGYEAFPDPIRDSPEDPSNPAADPVDAVAAAISSALGRVPPSRDRSSGTSSQCWSG